MAIFCNMLVCAGVLCGLSGKDTMGRIAGSYIPVAFFVTCGGFMMDGQWGEPRDSRFSQIQFKFSSNSVDKRR
jgi:hypothetical protein